MTTEFEPSAAATPETLSVFISYWRPDQTVVKRLAAALEEIGVSVKADWQLPGGAPYHGLLEDWITEVSSFVFVLTPESLASVECRKELDRALAQGKRIAPLVLRRVDAELAPAKIRETQWILWPDRDDVAFVAKRLREGVEADFDWEREHSRLIRREHDWDRAQRSRGLTLRGEDLRQAENWMARAGANPNLHPRPTPLLIDFIAQSRRDEKRAQRNLYISIIAVLLMLLAAGGFALRQTQARAESDQKASRSDRARADAEQARASQAVRTLEAERGQQAAKAVAERQTAEAARQAAVAAVNGENASRERLRRTQERGRQFLIEGDVTHAAPYLAAVYRERLANSRLGELATLRVMLARATAPLYGRRALLTKDTSGVEFAGFSPDESQIVTASEDGILRVWDASSGLLQYDEAPAPKSKMIGAVFSPDGRRLFTYENQYTESGDVELAASYRLHVSLVSRDGSHLADYTQRRGEPYPEEVNIEPPRFSADGRAFSFDFDLDYTDDDVFYLEDGEVIDVRRDATGFDLRPAPAPVVQQVASSSTTDEDDNEVPADAIEPGMKPEPKTPCSDSVTAPVWSSKDGQSIIDSLGMMYRTRDCEWLAFLEGPTPIRSATFSYDGRLVLASYTEGAVLWDWKQVHASLRAQFNLKGEDAVFTDDTARRILVSGTNVLDGRSVSDGSIQVETFKRPGATLIPLTERAIVETESTIELMATNSSEVLAKLELGRQWIESKSNGSLAEVWFADAATGLLMVKYPWQWDVVYSTTFELRRLGSGEKIGSIQSLGEDFDALAMNWKEGQIFTSSRSGYNASMWLDEFAGRSWNPDYLGEDTSFESVTAAAFMPDGSTIFAVGRDRRGRFYNTAKEHKIITTRLANAGAMVVSRDGRFAVVSNAEQTEIIDLDRHLSVGLCPGSTSGDRWATSADSRFVVTSGPNAVARICELESATVVTVLRLPARAAAARFSEMGSDVLVQAGPVTQIWNVGLETRSPDDVDRQVREFLPVHLEGERLVPSRASSRR